MTKAQKKEICKSLNITGKKYCVSDIKTGRPQKDTGCYVIKLIDGKICIYYGKCENGNFYTAHFTSSENIPKYDTDFKQSIYYKDANPDAYVLYK